MERCPRSSLSDSRLIRILPYRTLRLAGELSDRFFGPLTRFVPGVLDLEIALTGAFVFGAREFLISASCFLTCSATSSSLVQLVAHGRF